MLDQALEVMYEHETRKSAELELTDMLSQLPDYEIRKLASGTAIADLYPHLVKQADVPKTSDGNGTTCFLDKFEGTPLFEQAFTLEQAELQLEMQRLQESTERRKQTALTDSIWDKQDQLRLQKRLLELELAKQQSGSAAGGAAPPVPPEAIAQNAQGAGAPGDVPVEDGNVVPQKTAAFAPTPEHFKALGLNDKDSKNMAQNWGKVTSYLSDKDRESFHKEWRKRGMMKEATSAIFRDKTASAMFRFADALGRDLAREQMEEATKIAQLEQVGASAGALLKTAFGLGDVAGMAMKAAPKALAFAVKHPTATGAAVGAAGGALAGGPGNRLGGAAGGALVGAGLGHAAGGIGQRMSTGQGLGQAAKNYGGELAGKARSLVGGSGVAAGGATPMLTPPNVADFAAAPKPGLFSRMMG